MYEQKYLGKIDLLVDFPSSMFPQVTMGEPRGRQVSRDGNFACGIHPTAMGHWVSLCVCNVVGQLIVYQLGILHISILQPIVRPSVDAGEMITSAQELGTPVAQGLGLTPLIRDHRDTVQYLLCNKQTNKQTCPQKVPSKARNSLIAPSNLHVLHFLPRYILARPLNLSRLDYFDEN